MDGSGRHPESGEGSTSAHASRADDPPRRTRRLTPSNALTAIRLMLVWPFCASLLEGEDGLALALFWAAVATDLVDGRLARARGEDSAFGGLFDHATDALFASAGLAALARLGAAPVLLAPLVVGAFLQYALDSRVLAGRALRASWLGRWNGVLYFVPAGVFTGREGLGLAGPGDAAIRFVGWALIASTLVSMGDRAWATWRARARTRGGG
ncbi:MAG TPA: CDP-alcohol phosphatidyltransferase family protein [Myxococcota bacterium]|nr:CDP-alcohol phosphatidyltransferase family protein [Myxococcota bacterium]